MEERSTSRPNLAGAAGAIRAGIAAIACHLPEAVIDNAALAARHPRFQPDKVKAKTGIDRRHVAAAGECASDLAVAAAERLFEEARLDRDSVDQLVFCTQAPDYFLPTTACLIHERLGLRRSAGAIDVNLGCSGFVYGLGIAQGFIASGQARRVLLLTADTYSKYMDADDLAVCSIFGDGAAATLVEAGRGGLGPFIYGTDGSGGGNLIVPSGGLREPADQVDSHYVNAIGERRSGRPLRMNGPEIFNFTIGAVPDAVRAVLERAGLGPEAIDLFIFHQANATMLEALRRKLEIAPERFYVNLSGSGNTVSSTIPMALRRAAEEGRLQPGMRAMLVGFGVGYSWAATLIDWG